MDAAEMALRGRDLAVQYRSNLVQLLVDLDVLLGMALQELEDRRVDHGGSAAVRHICGKCLIDKEGEARGRAGRTCSLNFCRAREKRGVAGKEVQPYRGRWNRDTSNTTTNANRENDTRPSILQVSDVNTYAIQAAMRATAQSHSADNLNIYNI